MSIVVRLATPSDAKQIATIHVETWQNTYRGFIPNSYLNSLSIPNRTKKWLAMLNDKNDISVYFVGEINNRVMGWLSLCKCRDRDASSTWGELGGIYIHPLAQRKGLGTALMQEGLKQLKKLGYEKATLWVLTPNIKARGFYESKGWRLDGEIKVDPRDGFDLHETRYCIDL